MARKPWRPAASSERVRRQMALQLTRDTAPEVAIRRRLHAEGLRYRVNLTVLPKQRRRADIVFTRWRVAVFVDGCFWHGCPEHATQPKANAEWWRQKLSKNMIRDRETDRLLTESGWTVVRIWEHEDPGVATQKLVALLATIANPPSGDE